MMTAIRMIDWRLKNPLPRRFLAAGGCASAAEAVLHRAAERVLAVAAGRRGEVAADGGGRRGRRGCAACGGGRNFSVGAASGGCLRARICSVGGSGGLSGAGFDALRGPDAGHPCPADRAALDVAAGGVVTCAILPHQIAEGRVSEYRWVGLSSPLTFQRTVGTRPGGAMTDLIAPIVTFAVMALFVAAWVF